MGWPEQNRVRTLPSFIWTSTFICLGIKFYTIIIFQFSSNATGLIYRSYWSYEPGVFNYRRFSLSGDSYQWLETLLIFTILGGWWYWHLLGRSQVWCWKSYSAWDSLPQCRTIWFEMSVVLLLRNAGLTYQILLLGTSWNRPWFSACGGLSNSWKWVGETSSFQVKLSQACCQSFLRLPVF